MSLKVTSKDLPLIDVYWSFRSPYSYLATPDMMALRADYDVRVALRPVLPIAVRKPDFFDPAKAAWAKYILLDWPRRAEFMEMPAHWPSPDPIVQNLTTMKIASDQPYIFRLSSYGVEAERRGLGVPFAKEVAHLLFGGTRDWDKGEHLALAASRAGLDLGEMDAAIEGGDHLAELDANQAALEAAGHWGVPCFVFEGEPFFGQDRVTLLRWRLDQRGIAKR